MSNNGTVTVRAPLASDAEGIARVHVDSWRETYSGVLEDRFFSEDAYARRLEFWTRYLSMDPRPGRMAVALRDGAVIGFANAGDATGPDAEHGFTPMRTLHLFSIYLLNVAHDTGTGQALLDAVVSDEPAQLWVLRGNARAISFYRRNGFAADGAEGREERTGDSFDLSRGKATETWAMRATRSRQERPLSTVRLRIPSQACKR